ncbi:MAG: Nif3-like dinuclear metal center hexameric protein [Flavisolibacter sp.]
MKISDIVAVIEHYAAPELREEYDNVGLITGMKGWECTGVMCSLDATEEVISEAIEKKCNLLVVHHPIVFRGLKKINGKTYVERVIIKAIKHDIAIYAAHTNLDNIILGVNGMIAKKLGLENITILQPKHRILRRLITFAPDDQAEKVRNAVFAAGAGQIGKYGECSFNSQGLGTFKAMEGADPYVGKVGERHEEKETKIEIVYPFFLEDQVVKALVDNHPYEEVAYDIFTMDNIHFGIGAGIIGDLPASRPEVEFLNFVKETFGARGIRHSRLLGRPVQKIAVCGGAGSFLVSNAVQAGADMYITADMKYHEFFDAEGRLVIADIGHYESEQYTTDLIHDLLAEKFPTFAILKTGVNTNPVEYLA